jgi:hypothetical protein
MAQQNMMPELMLSEIPEYDDIFKDDDDEEEEDFDTSDTDPVSWGQFDGSVLALNY